MSKSGLTYSIDENGSTGLFLLYRTYHMYYVCGQIVVGGRSCSVKNEELFRLGSTEGSELITRPPDLVSLTLNYDRADSDVIS